MKYVTSYNFTILTILYVQYNEMVVIGIGIHVCSHAKGLQIIKVLTRLHMQAFCAFVVQMHQIQVCSCCTYLQIFKILASLCN